MTDKLDENLPKRNTVESHINDAARQQQKHR